MIDEQVPQEAPGARADEVRNERANEVAQDSLRSFETRNQETTSSGSNAEVNEAVTGQPHVLPKEEGWALILLKKLLNWN